MWVTTLRKDLDTAPISSSGGWGVYEPARCVPDTSVLPGVYKNKPEKVGPCRGLMCPKEVREHSYPIQTGTGRIQSPLVIHVAGM